VEHNGGGGHERRGGPGGNGVGPPAPALLPTDSCAASLVPSSPSPAAQPTRFRHPPHRLLRFSALVCLVFIPPLFTACLFSSRFRPAPLHFPSFACSPPPHPTASPYNKGCDQEMWLMQRGRGLMLCVRVNITEMNRVSTECGDWSGIQRG
jgi:hypothetical protein